MSLEKDGGSSGDLSRWEKSKDANGGDVACIFLHVAVPTVFILRTRSRYPHILMDNFSWITMDKISSA